MYIRHCRMCIRRWRTSIRQWRIENRWGYIKQKEPQVKNLQLLVPRPGIEPGWVAPLVFETSASTDSAIWAMVILQRKEPQVKNLQLFVPRPGIEPGWIAPLVFETSASTDSAIWAIAGAKVQIKIEIANFLATFFLKNIFYEEKKLKMCCICPIFIKISQNIWSSRG